MISSKHLRDLGEYIHENVLNHWYNFFFPWINNNATKSIFDSTTLICLWTIVSMIFITPIITGIIYIFIDVYKVYNNGRYNLLDKEIARFKLFHSNRYRISSTNSYDNILFLQHFLHRFRLFKSSNNNIHC